MLAIFVHHFKFSLLSKISKDPTVIRDRTLVTTRFINSAQIIAKQGYLKKYQ